MSAMKKPVLFCSALMAAFMVCACSNEQTYNSLQNYQKNQCNKHVDNAERERCLKDADTSYGDYKKQTATP
jgi:hypothetical protein